MKKLHFTYSAIKPVYFLMCVALLLSACGGGKPGDDSGDDDKAVNGQVPVTVTGISDSSMVDYTTLNATSTFQQKNYVKSNTNGYVVKVNAHQGQYVNKGAVLFVIKTKEAQSIGNAVNVLDSTFKFSGTNKITAAEHGYIQLSHQAGDYVQDGEQLAVISDRSSFAFIMQLPYEMRSNVKQGQDVQLSLPDGRKVDGRIASFMPAVDTAAQTQGVVIKIADDNTIPENLIAKARIVRTSKQNTASLPKSAILTNETETEFWVMKLINPTTAVKVPVKKGIEVGDRVEILSPTFTKDDKIVVTGNYGLSDTAKVKIVQ